MEITAHGLWTTMHGMGFGALYLLTCSGAIVELWRRWAPSAAGAVTARDETFLRVYFVVMARNQVSELFEEMCGQPPVRRR